jgi:hypothetical protein
LSRNLDKNAFNATQTEYNLDANMRKTAVVATFISIILLTAAAATQLVNSEETNYPTSPLITMPVEYVNYTITTVNGSLWAKIDGTYPLNVLYWQGALPLVYPTPPGTTNISLKMDETELSWNNFTEIYPEAVHFTAIGNWPMINCIINPVPEYFTLKIHYEHPVVLINGSHTFLYDLNITPYLSKQSTKSTAYFTIRMETNYTSLHVNTIATDETVTPINYTATTEDTAETVTFQIVSEYGKPLLGDILVTFTTANAPTAVEFSYLLIILPIALIATIIARVVYKRKTH